MYYSAAWHRVVIWEDPRSFEGEVLNSLRFNKKQVDDLKRSLGAYGYAGQCQQRASPVGGGILKKKWFKLWGSPVKPKFDYILSRAGIRQFPMSRLLAILPALFGEYGVRYPRISYLK